MERELAQAKAPIVLRSDAPNFRVGAPNNYLVSLRNAPRGAVENHMYAYFVINLPLICHYFFTSALMITKKGALSGLAIIGACSISLVSHAQGTQYSHVLRSSKPNAIIFTIVWT